MKKIRLTSVDEYRPLVGEDVIKRLKEKARPLQRLHVVNINSTYYGGGVAQLLSSETLLMNDLGIKTGWRVIQGSPEFFTITKKMHNALQGADINLTDRKMHIYESVICENAVRNHLDHDVVIVHDPQPLPMIKYYKKDCPWIWRCHIDLSSPHEALWNRLTPYVEKYDAIILSGREYKQDIKPPQLFFMPAIDPFTTTNREMTDSEIEDRLSHYNIPTDLPLVVQVSRFDRWKDPEGVIKAFQLASKQVDCTLVLVGNVATDDPEGNEVFKSLLGYRNDRIIILTIQDGALVNALQRKAAVVLQKSLREGFGLTVTEAMWKGSAVIGGNVGGIRYQIEDGVNGFLVDSIEQAAERIVQVIKDRDLRKRLGKEAKESVRNNFLMTRLVEQHLDLLSSFKIVFRLTDRIKKYQ
ncbi:MAG: glycosyltransferase [Dehalococcoidia bacterium]